MNIYCVKTRPVVNDQGELYLGEGEETTVEGTWGIDLATAQNEVAKLRREHPETYYRIGIAL